MLDYLNIINSSNQQKCSPKAYPSADVLSVSPPTAEKLSSPPSSGCGGACSIEKKRCR